MRSVFPEHFRPSASDFKELWSECIFCVDANVILNLYRYSPETRTELEKALNSIQERLFIPHQAAKEFLKNRLNVTANQAEEYTKAIRSISDLEAILTNKKKHPFIEDGELPRFKEHVASVVKQLNSQKTVLLNRLTEDEILEFSEKVFANRTGKPFDEEALKKIVEEGEIRYQKEIPPGYKDGKKDTSNDPYRKFGDLIVWKQLIDISKEKDKPVIFITDDKKEDWWLEQSGRTIGPRTELREEFISSTSKDFWMYTVDKFIEEAAISSNTAPNKLAIAEIIEVSNEVKSERITTPSQYPFFKAITREEMLNKLEYSEKWAAEHNAGFLGLGSYVKNYLGQAGYDYAASYDVIRQLEEEGLVEVYDHQGEGHERAAKAIRLAKRNQFSNRPLENLRELIEVKTEDSQLSLLNDSQESVRGLV